MGVIILVAGINGAKMGIILALMQKAILLPFNDFQKCGFNIWIIWGDCFNLWGKDVV